MIRRILLIVSLALAALGGVAAFMVDDASTLAPVSRGDGANIPNDLEGHRIWLMNSYAGGAPFQGEALSTRFTEQFLAAVPPAELRRQMADMAKLGSWHVSTEVERRGEDVLVVQLVSAMTGRGDEQARLTIKLAPDRRIAATTFLGAEPCEIVPANRPLDPAVASGLTWFRELVDGGRIPDDSELEERLHPAFLAQVPAQEFRRLLPQLRGLGPLTERYFEGEPGPREGKLRVGVSTGEEARITIAVNKLSPHRITGLSIYTQPPCRLPAGYHVTS